jgi:hypothetical protein
MEKYFIYFEYYNSEDCSIESGSTIVDFPITPHLNINHVKGYIESKENITAPNEVTRIINMVKL